MDLRRVRERRKDAVLPATVAVAAMNHLYGVSGHAHAEDHN